MLYRLSLFMRKYFAFSLFMLIYLYVFIVGLILAIVLRDSFGYYIPNIKFTATLLALNLLFSVLAFILGKYTISRIRTSDLCMFSFLADYPTSSGITGLLGFSLVLDRMFRMSFLPFWIYGGIPPYESTLVGIGFSILSISAGLDSLVLFRNTKSKRAIIVIMIAKLLILLLYGKSRSLLLWFLAMLVFGIVLKTRNTRRLFLLFFALLIVGFFGMILYRSIIIDSLGLDERSSNMLKIATIAPEFKDLSNFLMLYSPTLYPEEGKRILTNMLMTMLPDGVWKSLGIDKFEIGFFDRSSFFHSILFGSTNSSSGVRITVYGEMYMISGLTGILVGSMTICFVLGVLTKFDLNMFLWLLGVNLAISQLNGLHVITFRLIPIIMVVFLNQRHWMLTIQHLRQRKESHEVNQ